MIDREKIDKESGAVLIGKDSALYKEQKFSGIAYSQLFPISTIYCTQNVDYRNFNSDFRRIKELERADMISKMDVFKETQYQYTDE